MDTKARTQEGSGDALPNVGESEASGKDIQRTDGSKAGEEDVPDPDEDDLDDLDGTF